MPSNFQHKFVDFVPQEIEEGILYVSVEFATASHLCACGCKQRVVTPLSPRGWTLSFDGETVTLDPSIGNWAFPCRSHYWFRNNRIAWAADWSQKRIEETRDRRKRAIKAHHDKPSELPRWLRWWDRK
jgi:hypothetical protein